MGDYSSQKGMLKYVRVSENLCVADARRDQVIEDAVGAYRESESTGEAKIATALHVGGLNALSTPGFLEALGRARIVYADGMAVVLLAKFAGAKRIERAATTDIGVPIIEAVSTHLQRPARIALVGGECGLADSAAAALSAEAFTEVVFSTHGFRTDEEWQSVLSDLREKSPDIVILGLGSPRELIFADRHRAALPASLILTCGGWFGFLAGEESRAHWLLQKFGLEWIARLFHSPRRLASRYAQGVLVFVKMAVLSLGLRVRRRP